MRIYILNIFILFLSIGHSQDDSTMVKELLDIADSYEKTNMDSAIYTYKKAAKLAEDIDYWIGAGRGISYTGIVFSDYGMNDSAIVYHKKSIPLYEKANYLKGKASSLINVGNAYQFQGNYEKAIDYYMLGIADYEKLQDTGSLSISYSNLASLFLDYKNYEKSKYYQTKALDYSYIIHDTISIAYSLNDLGLTYLALQQKDSAFVKFKEALDIANAFNDTELKYLSNKNLNNYYFDDNNFSKAYYFAIKSYRNALETKKPYYVCYALNALGSGKLKLNELDSAYYYVKKSIAVASKIRAKEHLMDGYYTLNLIYSKQRKYKKAYDALQLYNIYHDSVVGQKQQEYTSKLEQQYQVKNKDNEILQQKLEIETKEAFIQKKINQNGIYLVGGLIFAFTAFILWYRHRHKQKLHLQSIETLNKQKELAELEALIEGEDMERSRIAKDLHDSVNGNLSAIKHNLSSISQENLKEDEHQTFNNAIEMLDNTCEQIRNISHDLVPPSLLNYGLIEALGQYINRINTINLTKISFQDFGKLKILSKKTETTIYHIIQELLTNIVKHANADKGIVQINANNKLLHITVEDDGKGYDINAVSHGLGLNNIKSRVQFLNAEMDVKSDAKGTSVVIDIDLKKIQL